MRDDAFPGHLHVVVQAVPQSFRKIAQVFINDVRIAAILQGLDRVFFLVKPHLLIQVPTKASEADIPNTSYIMCFKTFRVVNGLFPTLCFMNAITVSDILEYLEFLWNKVP